MPTTHSGKQPQPVSPPRTNQANKRSLASPNSPKNTRKKPKKKASEAEDENEPALAPAPKKKAKKKSKATRYVLTHTVLLFFLTNYITRTTADKDAEVAAAPVLEATGYVSILALY